MSLISCTILVVTYHRALLIIALDESILKTSGRLHNKYVPLGIHSQYFVDHQVTLKLTDQTKTDTIMIKLHEHQKIAQNANITDLGITFCVKNSQEHQASIILCQLLISIFLILCALFPKHNQTSLLMLHLDLISIRERDFLLPLLLWLLYQAYNTKLVQFF